MVKEAMFYDKLDANAVRCRACAHFCKISPSKKGICGVRENIEGVLNTLVYARPVAVNIDPIEKKPLFHFLPGSSSYSIATVGCNFKCGFCQNWQISQVSGESAPGFGSELLPEKVVSQAKSSGAKSISYTYTEPVVFFEYAYDTAKLAKKQGLKNVFVTNGYITKEALKAISPYLNAANVDLKSFREEFYVKNCAAHLAPVLESIKLMKELGVWIELTTLVIPGENDSEDELKDIAGFIAKVGREVPWHISRFSPCYKFKDYSPTPVETLRKAYNIGKQAGLKYVYLGNVLEGASTYCPGCNKALIKRSLFDLVEKNIKKGKCSFCGARLDGVFE